MYAYIFFAIWGMASFTYNYSGISTKWPILGCHLGYSGGLSSMAVRGKVTATQYSVVLCVGVVYKVKDSSALL